MKITSVRTHVVDAFRVNYVFVRIETDENIHGVGEATLETKELTVAAAIGQLADYLVGQDPLRIEHHTHMMNRDSYWRTGAILRSALAGVEAALLDIKGKALGVPVYELLGGRQRDRIRCYANAWFTGASTADEFAAAAVATVAKGFTALKWDPFGSAYMTMTRRERHACVEIVEAVRSAVGSSIDLMIEGHGRFDVPTAIAIARDIAPFEPTWFEEPTPPESIDAVATVRASSPVPIATGERYFDPASFAELIEKRAADFLQPDISHVGGLGEAKKIATLAQVRYLPICPHNPLGPVTNAMTLQFAAATSNVVWLETMVADVPWRKELAPNEQLSIVDGHMLIPDTPGLGIDIDEVACAQHPYKAYALRHYNGTWTKIRPGNESAFYQDAKAGQHASATVS